MIGCIYHEADLDGVMSAAIVKKYFKGDIDLLPYNYGKEIPDVNKYDKVFVVDVSFGSRTRFLFDEWKEKGIDVVWIDHHKTAIDDYGFGLFEYNGALYFKEADEGNALM